jgi:hypothetical protein
MVVLVAILNYFAKKVSNVQVAVLKDLKAAVVTVLPNWKVFDLNKLLK